jgi:uncharacterized protein (TIGR04255 family)
VRKAPEDLPKFRKPPVVEVAIAVQFAELSALRNVHLGLLWNRYRDKYSQVEEHGPLVDIVEKFEPERRRIGVTIETTDQPPVPRMWLVNSSGTRLIQIQRSRFIHNWRKLATEEPYPRYPDIRAQFAAAYRTFEAFVADENVGPLLINQCEITYVNHIDANGWTNHGDASKVITVFTPRFTDDFLSNPEDVNLAVRFRIHNDLGHPVGRLHVQLESAFRSVTNDPIFVLTMTARGRPAADDIGAALQFLDLGRRWIVKGFTSVTTAEMHKRWERLHD